MRFWIVLVAALAAALAGARPDRNSFLNERARSIDQVISQARKDPEVMDRYRRHFSMSDAEVIRFLSSLRLGATTSDKTYLVYSVPPDGSIKVHAQIFHEGTAVYIDMTGNPTLIAKCGNPLHRGPKGVVAVNEGKGEVGESATTLKTLEETEPLTTNEIIQATAIQTPGEPIETEVVTESKKPIIIPAAGLGIGPWIVGILGGGGIAILGGGHSRGPSPVPEPAAYAAMGIGLAALLRRKRR
jgi:hypothetical protein